MHATLACASLPVARLAQLLIPVGAAGAVEAAPVCWLEVPDFLVLQENDELPRLLLRSIKRLCMWVLQGLQEEVHVVRSLKPSESEPSRFGRNSRETPEELSLLSIATV